jgi:hypothetical protein
MARARLGGVKIRLFLQKRYFEVIAPDLFAPVRLYVYDLKQERL